MNLQQLKAICEIVDRGLTVSAAADATHHSQSSVTRQVQALEEELGFKVFVRSRNRLARLSPKGEEIVALARRVLQDVENMRRIGSDAAHDKRGVLTLALTHVQARYVMPPTIHGFINSHPQVTLNLRQGNPAQVCALVAAGKADLGLCSDPRDLPEDLVGIPTYRLHRSVVTPAGHPLLRARPLTLEKLVRYPLISYDEAFTGRVVVTRAFAERGLTPNIVLSATDADVSKVYVELGLGVAIFDSVAFDPRRDAKLRRIDARHLFAPSVLTLVLRRDTYLRSYMYAFINTFAPRLTRRVIDAVLLNSVADIEAEDLAGRG